jgi:hypothetical protein
MIKEEGHTMFELRRIINPVEIIYCDATMNPIRPYDWYWHDPQTGYNYTLDIVATWKEKALKNALPQAKMELKAYENQLKVEKVQKKAAIKQRQLDYMQSILDEYSDNK